MNKKYLIYILLPVAVALALIFGFFKKDLNLPVENNPEAPGNQIYTSEEYGFSFEYPDNYVVEVKDVDTVNRKHQSFILMPKGYVQPEGGEGPTTINIDVYQNNLDKQSVEAWIKGSASSNYKLGDGLITSLKINGKEALAYDWDGLYRGHTTVLEHNQNIIAVSVTYLDMSDRIKSDYENLLNSFKFSTISVDSKLPQTILENYFKENISTISPEKETLGGKFYITDLKLNDGTSGVVSYEDGHVAFVADFTYSISSEGGVTINSFKIRK
jgi:hypothetical protein